MTSPVSAPAGPSSPAGATTEYQRGYTNGYHAAAYRATRARVGRPMRWNRELREFEMQCLDCRAKCRASYWPMTLEFWKPSNVQRCRACVAEHDREKQRRRREDPAIRERDAANARAWRDAHPGYNAETARLWREQNPDRKKATDRDYDERRRKAA